MIQWGPESFTYLQPFIVAVLLWTCRGLLELLRPVQRDFFLDDYSIQHPSLPSIVPVWMLFVLSLVVPVVIVAAVKRRSAVTYLCAFFIAVGIVEIITTILKNMVGRLRPNFIAVCQPIYPTNMTYSYMHPYYTNGCKDENDPTTMDARMSFPSGHSSMSFTGLGFLSLVLLHHFKNTGLLVRIFSLSPYLLAFYIAISRTRDNHHHWQDITVGAFIGIAVSYKIFHHFEKTKKTVEVVVPNDESDRLLSRSHVKENSVSPESVHIPLDEVLVVATK